MHINGPTFHCGSLNFSKLSMAPNSTLFCMFYFILDLKGQSSATTNFILILTRIYSKLSSLGTTKISLNNVQTWFQYSCCLVSSKVHEKLRNKMCGSFYHCLCLQGKKSASDEILGLLSLCLYGSCSCGSWFSFCNKAACSLLWSFVIVVNLCPNDSLLHKFSNMVLFLSPPIHHCRIIPPSRLWYTAGFGHAGLSVPLV